MTDRELDAAIAERVMGWVAYGAMPGTWRDASGNWTKECQHYSTDPIASQVLKDHMREAGWFYVIQYRCSDKNVSACFYRGEDEDNREGYAIANNEIRAIAEAALATAQ